MKMIAMDSKIPLSNLEGVGITLVKSTCPKEKIKPFAAEHHLKVSEHYKIIPIEVSCPIAFQWQQPIFTLVKPTFNFLQYHYKVTANVDGFKTKFSPPPQQV